MIGGIGVTKIELWNADGSAKIDGFTFTRSEEHQIRMVFNDLLDCPDKLMDNFSIKRFPAGKSIEIEIDFTFDDWDASVSDTLGHSCQTFLKDLHNHIGRIKLTPHTDKPAQVYWVLRENPWAYLYPYGRWVGVKGILRFKGSVKIANIDIME